MARKIGWGVLGASGIARRRTIPEGILPARNARLIAVQSRSASRAAGLSREFGGAHPYVEEVDLLRDPQVEAVYVATPVYRHADQVLAAARAGKHILVEKPLALSARDAQRMVRGCRDAGVLLGVGFMMRFHSAHQRILRWIRSGALGVPLLGRAQLGCWYPPARGAWRQDPRRGGGGAVVDLATHCLDLLTMLLGPVRSVSAEVATRVHRYPVEDTAALLLRFESGAFGFVDCSFALPDAAGESVCEIYGSKGCVKTRWTVGQDSRGELRACLVRNGGAYDSRQSRPSKGFVASDLPAKNVYRSEIEAFSQAILDSGRPPVPGEVGLECQRLVEAVYRAARWGRRVTLVQPPKPSGRTT